jgi:hypothetical protein
MNKQDIEEYKKIGVEVLRIYKDKRRWVFKKDGHVYEFAPADIVKTMLSPTILGANRVIEVGCKIKGIRNPEGGFYLLFSTSYFPNSDVKLLYNEIKFNGWTYSVESLNLKVPEVVESIWVCPYLGSYFKEPPQTLYLRIIEQEQQEQDEN